MVVIDETAIPVTVLDLGSSTQGLGVTRSLGRLGIPVYVIGFDRQIAFLSRYCYRKISFPTFEFNEQSVRDVLAVGSRIGRKSILIPTTDQGAVFVNDNAEALKEWFIFPNLKANVARSLSSKEKMYHLAKRHQIPTAEASFPQRGQNVLDSNKILSFPVMLKPLCNWCPPFHKVIVRNEHELLKNYDVMDTSKEPNVILQEYIPGEDDTGWIFHGYFNQDSDCLFGFTAKKMRQWPPYHGVTSLGVCLRNETVSKTAKKFMKAVAYRGIVDIDSRYDPRDDQYKILDVNPRLGGNFRLFVTNNGMDIIRALYLDMTGQHFTPGVLSQGRKWLSEDVELQASILYHEHGNLPFKKWIDSYRGIRELALFAFDDPLPFLLQFLRKVPYLLKHRLDILGYQAYVSVITRYLNQGDLSTAASILYRITKERRPLMTHHLIVKLYLLTIGQSLKQGDFSAAEPIIYRFAQRCGLPAMLRLIARLVVSSPLTAIRSFVKPSKEEERKTAVRLAIRQSIKIVLRYRQISVKSPIHP